MRPRRPRFQGLALWERAGSRKSLLLRVAWPRLSVSSFRLISLANVDGDELQSLESIYTQYFQSLIGHFRNGLQ